MRPSRREKREESEDPAFRSGFVSFIGRPNVGKSTLMNALVGEKVAITSAKPQTTRHAIRGIVTRPDGQLIIVDTPGIHRPRTLLGERLNALAQSTLSDVDVIGMCFPADEPVGKGDRYIADQLGRFPGSRSVAIVTKSDKVAKTVVAERLLEVSQLTDWAAVIPVSAVNGEQVTELADLLLSLLPEGPALYETATLTDEDQDTRVAELVRESLLEVLDDELPHSVAVTLEETVPREDSEVIDVYANIFVERDSQKAIVIGKGGQRLRETGEISRKAIEALLGRRIYLHLQVKVAKEWQRDPKKLERLGF